MDAHTSNTSAPLHEVLAHDGQSDVATKGIATLVLLAITIFGYWVRSAGKPYRGFILAGKAKGEWSNKPAKQRWATNSVQVVKEGMEKAGGKPFQVITTSGPLIVLPIEYLDDVKSNEHCSLALFAKRDFYGNYPGLEVFGSNDQIFSAVVRQKLTQALGGMTATLSEETELLLNERLGKADEWTDVSFNSIAEGVASQLSALAFIGRPLCRNKDWLEIASSYTVNCVRTVRRAAQIHPLLLPLVYRFLPEARILQQQRRQAKAFIEPVVMERRKARFEALQAGKKYEGSDAVSWFEDIAQGRPYDFVSGQLSLATAAIHTTSANILIIMYDILRHPELITPLREEVARVITEDGGWKKTSLYKFRLLDSVMKESIRVTTSSPFAMRRYAEKDIPLSDGSKIPKGAYFLVSYAHQLESDQYGGEFDGYRFLNRRQEPAGDGAWQFVTTGPDNLRFGHGTHACPGRFFAANEMKIALAHLLLKYDWKFKGKVPMGRQGEYEYVPDPKTMLQYRSRQPEIDL